MDSIESLFQSEPTTREPKFIRLLNPAQMSAEDMGALWLQVSKQQYAFDDFSRGRVEWFAALLSEVGALHFLANDFAWILVRNAYKERDCNIHFCVFDNTHPFKEVIEAGREVLSHLFTVTEVQRVTGFIPSFNRQASRFATVMGFKYEGCIRKSVKWQGKFHDISVYGMLKTDFEQKGLIQ